MEIKEFSKLLLSGESLEDKLFFPAEELTDLDPAFEGDLPCTPGRPARLRLDVWQERGKTNFPKLEQFADPQVRGRVLHFFANHELLALEIMALTLLKFPDAPKAFRRTLVSTIREEQSHLSLYLNRMRELGVDFGDIAVNDFFWSAAQKMRSPVDYTTQMSLTFEQANLDYAVFYERAFKAVEDKVSANIMKQVLEDEIGHVRSGLAWFRKWKPEDCSEWDAYQESLPYPLSPARAKGNWFAEEPRQRAGLSQEFIDEVEVYADPLGQNRRFFYCNPLAEEEVRAGIQVRRSKLHQDLFNDLSPVFGALATSNDYLAVRERPPLRLLKQWDQCGFSLPRYVPLNDEALSQPNIPEGVQYVAWATVPDESAIHGKHVRPELVSKAFPLQWLQQQKLQPEFVALEHTGRTVHSRAEISEWFSFYERRGFASCVVKAPLSAAGRERVWLRSGELISVATETWLDKQLRAHGTLLLQPWLQRTLDLSFLFSILDSRHVRFDGMTRLLNDPKGAYAGNVVGRPFLDVNERQKRFLYHKLASGKTLLQEWQNVCESYVISLAEDGYTGPVGIDGFVYEVQGTLFIYPIIESNLRYTMGFVAHKWGSRMMGGRIGILHQVRIGSSAWNEFQIAEQRQPLRIDPVTKLIDEGTIWLADPSAARKCGYVFEVKHRESGRSGREPVR